MTDQINLTEPKHKVDIVNCPLCGDNHNDYTVKRDSTLKHYVICGIMQKKMMITSDKYYVKNLRKV